MVAVRLHDLTEDGTPFLHSYVFHCENTRENDSYAHKPTYLVADLCKEIGIEALEYPSVRGEYRENPHAVNIVVFSPAFEDLLLMTDGVPFELSL
jgi:hypothetical protein